MAFAKSTLRLFELKSVCRLRIPRQALSVSICHHNEKIVIPKRIPRSPTDILEALASTVGRDMSGPHYKYMDDPYLTPASNLHKRSFSLSKESGRKAARWIRDKHGDLFMHQPDDPVIEAFYPKITFTEESNVSEDTICDLIQKSLVTDAIQVYQICQEKNIELSEEVRQELLEFISFYNAEETLDEDWVEERWYNQGGIGRSGVRKTWKDNGVAEELFQSLSNKDSKAFCALIRGMSNYFQIDRAWQLYQEASEKEIALDTNTYNAVLKIAPYLREAAELQWQLMQELLTTMAEKGVTPTLGTLNSILEALVQLSGWRQTRDLSLQVVSEFRSIGIQPSLATYYFLLLIHCRERGPISKILLSILEHIDGKEFEFQDMKDTFFFVTAMDICCNHLKSLEAAHLVHKQLNTGGNHILMGDAYKESIYYRHYFSLASSSETAHGFMNMYHDMVPHVYTPEPSVMLDILRSLKVHDAVEYLPEIWSDMIVFDHTTQEKLVRTVLDCAASHQPTDENTQLTKQIVEIANDIWTRLQGQTKETRRKIAWTGQMIGNVITALVRGDDYKKAAEVFEEAYNNPHVILGSASADSLKELSKAAIEKEDASIAVNIAVYAADVGHQEASDLAKDAASKLNLSQQQEGKLTTLLGIDFMKS